MLGFPDFPKVFLRLMPLSSERWEHPQWKSHHLQELKVNPSESHHSLLIFFQVSALVKDLCSSWETFPLSNGDSAGEIVKTPASSCIPGFPEKEHQETRQAKEVITLRLSRIEGIHKMDHLKRHSWI